MNTATKSFYCLNRNVSLSLNWYVFFAFFFFFFVKKFLSCTDTAAVEAQKIINKEAKETGFPCISIM